MTADRSLGSIALRRPVLAGVAAVVTLGVLRGGIQVAAQQRYAQAGFILLVIMAATVLWLPVPAFIAWCNRELEGFTRVIMLGTGAAGVVVLEPVWFLSVVRGAGVWNPPAGFFVIGVLRSDTNLLIFAAITAAYWLADANRREARAAGASMELRRRAAEAELEILTMQLQPHFLFNTLNLVSQLAYESASRARWAIANLRRLLRESMMPNGGGTGALARELELIEAYLDIQRERFGSKLVARVHVDPDVLNARVPRLLLQPVVENAIRHGISQQGRGGALDVRVVRVDDRLRITVSDDGVGPGAHVREGMGLRNVRHRLDQVFPDRARVELTARPERGAVTLIELPLEAVETATIGDGSADASDGSEALALVSEAATTGRRVGDIGMVGRIALTVLGWMAIAGIWTEVEAVIPRALNRAIPWGAILARNGLIASALVCLTPAVVWLTRRLAARGARVRVAGHVAGALLFATIHLTVTGFLLTHLASADAASIREVLISWPVWDLVAYAVLSSAVATLAVRRALRLHAVDALASHAKLAAARVALVRLQVQPGTLFAGLAEIEASVDCPERCEEVIAGFGDVLRSLLAVAEQERVLT